MTTKEKTKEKKKLFVIDTNVFMHEPLALFQFEEHDLFIPMIVLEELDTAKKGLSELARNVREINRLLDQLICNVEPKNIDQGLPLQSLNRVEFYLNDATGRVFFQTEEMTVTLPTLPGHKADNSILSTTKAAHEKFKDHQVILVSKDINMRIKAKVLGLEAQDYFSDRVLDDISKLPTGVFILPDDFWGTHGKDVSSWKTEGKTYYEITGPDVAHWFPNAFLSHLNEFSFEALVRKKEKENTALVEVTRDYTHAKNAVWGILARNREQNFALNLLMDPDIDFVSLQGIAGTGKTLLALAAGLTLCFEEQRYREIIMTRVTVPLGEDIGFLPGTEEEKMTPWMGALMDNLEVLSGNKASTPSGSIWEADATQDILNHRIKIRSLNFMRGRTFFNRFIIIDEAQNLTPKQIKTLITRAGPGTKIVCLGDLAQIDTPYLTANTSGLTYAIHHFKPWEHSGHVTLTHGERSRLADFAADHL